MADNKGSKSAKLTPKQELFVQGLFTGLSQRDAYKQSYNAEGMLSKTIDEKASILANNDKIRTRLDELTNELKERNMVTVERILAELSKVGFANGSDFARVVEKSYIEEVKDEDGNIIDIKEHKYKAVEVMPTDQLEEGKLAAIAGIKSTKDGIEVKTNDKIKALELMGKHLGMFVDKVESVNVNLNQDITNLTDEELDAELNRLKNA